MSLERLIYLISFTLFFNGLCFGQSEKSDLRVSAKNETNDTLKLKLLNKLAYSFVPKAPDSIIHYSTIGIELYEKIKAAYKNELNVKKIAAESHYNIALAHSIKRQMDTTIILIRKSIDLFKETGDHSQLGNSYKLLAIQYFRLGKNELCIAANDSAIQVYNKIGDERLKSSAMHNKAQAYKQSGDYVKSLNLYLEALKIKKRVGVDSTSLTNTLNEICTVYYLNNDYDQAEKYCLEALSIRKITHAGSSVLAGSILNMGVLYMTMKEFDKAIGSFEESIEMTKNFTVNKGDKKYGDQIIAIAVNNLAELYSIKNDYSKAEEYILRAIELTKNVNDIQTLSMNHNIAGSIFIKNKKYNKAIQYLEESVRLAKECGSLNDHKNALRNLSKVYSHLENYKESLRYYDLYRVMNDSLFSITKSEQIAEIQTKYETEKKDNEIQLLNSENELKDLRLSQTKKEQNYLIAGIIVVALFSFLMFLNYSAKQKANIALEKALNDREILLKEIHHRVKNNLQIISSLLNLQSKHVDDKLAIEAVKEGRNRVKSMAIIHQKLYKENNLTGVTISEYINNLATSLFNSYGVDEDHIKLKTDIDDLILDIDTTIPLGLILNELITNSLKYAFPNNQSGELLVSLKKSQDKLNLLISDNGIGMNQDEDSKDTKSFGLKLVNSLARKLKATVEVDNSTGTSVTLQITNFKIA